MGSQCGHTLWQRALIFSLKNANFHPRIYMEHIGIGRVLILKGNIEERACELATYIIENRTTVREAARRFGISKSTVHMDIVK